MRITILLLIMVLSINAAYAATYYIDAVSGSDTNNGLSASTAWRTVSKANTKIFSPGDNILFHRGQIWRELLSVSSSGNSNNYIMYGAYGSGESSIISGSDLIVSGWSRYAANVWMTTLTMQPHVVFFNNVRGNEKTSLSLMTSEYDWYWSSNTLYVYSPSDISPSTVYTNPGIEAGSRSRSLETNDKSYIIFDGLTFRDGNVLLNGQINVGSNFAIGIIFRNCVIERGASTGIYTRGLTQTDSIGIDNCTIQNNAGHGINVFVMFNSGYISNSRITGNGWGGVRDSEVYSGINGYLGNLNIYGNQVYDNNAGCGDTGNHCHGIYAGESPNITNIYNNTIYDDHLGVGISMRGSANIYNNRIYNNYGSGINIPGNRIVDVSILIYNNLIYNNEQKGDVQGGIWEGMKGTGKLNLTIYNNLLYDNGGTTQQEININDAVTSLTIENNIFFTLPTRHTMVIATQTGTVKIDNNIHWRPDGNPSIYYGGSGKTWLQWQSLGFDQHGLNLDPYLNNPSGGDFSLQNNSPAIDTGVDVGLTSDFFGNPIVGIPDIGAIEYDSGQYNPADTNHDGCISLGEISVYVGLWLQGSVTLGEVSAAVSIWLGGC